jgi:glucose-6-phosphate isomerase
VVNIGIGGSDLGPQHGLRGAAPYRHPELNLHFVSNVDGAHLQTLARLDPATTLFIVASKTFTTQETMTNAQSARAGSWPGSGADADVRWPAFRRRSRPTTEAVQASASIPANMFVFWDWVGGRYSLWSAIGLVDRALSGLRAVHGAARGRARHGPAFPQHRSRRTCPW